MVFSARQASVIESVRAKRFQLLTGARQTAEVVLATSNNGPLRSTSNFDSVCMGIGHALVCAMVLATILLMPLIAKFHDKAQVDHRPIVQNIQLPSIPEQLDAAAKMSQLQRTLERIKLSESKLARPSRPAEEAAQKAG